MFCLVKVECSLNETLCTFCATVKIVDEPLETRSFTASAIFSYSWGQPHLLRGRSKAPSIEVCVKSSAPSSVVRPGLWRCAPPCSVHRPPLRTSGRYQGGGGASKRWHILKTFTCKVKTAKKPYCMASRGGFSVNIIVSIGLFSCDATASEI
jgi:hypothetical protein